MLTYPNSLDENVSRPVASIVFTFTLITLILPNLQFIIYLVFLDFILRYIHPKLSPLVFVVKTISRNILKNEVLPYFSPPKRFAILIGIVITGLMSISLLFSIDYMWIILNFTLLLASVLQGFFGYCIGCKVFDILVRFKVIKQNKKISNTVIKIWSDMWISLKKDRK